MKRLDRVLALLFPPRCASCNVLLDWYEASRKPIALCKSCQKEWDDACNAECGVCRKKLSRCRCLTEELRRAQAVDLGKLVFYRSGDKNSVSNRVIFSIKNHRDRRTVTWLALQLQEHAERIAERVGKENVVITYAPRGARAIHESGTDQARELARALSRLTGIDVIRAIGRTRERVSAQKKLSPTQRMSNAKKTYQPISGALPKVAGRTVILIDDILTTGATTAACTRLLRKMGAVRVHGIVVATDDVNRDEAVRPNDETEEK